MEESSLQKLLRDYCRRQIPTPSEELHWAALVRRWLDHPDGPDGAPLAVQRAGHRAKNRLVEGNVRWVITIAKKHCRSCYSEDRMLDAIQSGILGLIKAVERFDHQRGYKLSTFSYFWILQGIQRGEEYRNVIRIPDSVLAECRKIERAIAELQQKGLNQTKEHLASITKIPIDRLRARLEMMPLRSLVSLDVQCGGGDLSSLVELIADPSESVDQNMENLAMIDWLDANLEALPETQRQALVAMREGRNRKAVARELGISPAGVSFRQAAAIKTLQQRMQHHQPLAA